MESDGRPEPRQLKQSRAKATYEALLGAAAEVFAERGFEATQTPEIAARAGVSTGAFYRYFKDKREVFLELARHHLARAHADVRVELDPTRLGGTDPRGVVDAILQMIFAHTRKNAA